MQGKKATTDWQHLHRPEKAMEPTPRPEVTDSPKSQHVSEQPKSGHTAIFYDFILIPV